MDRKIFLNNKNPISLLIFVGALIVGLFNEPICIAAGIALSVMLFSKVIKNRTFIIPYDYRSITVAIVVFGFLVASFWGIDKYYSLLGFFKFLPIFLLLIYIANDGKNNYYSTLQVIPDVGVLMVLVSLICYRFEKIKHLFSVNNRISGFFQYPSTFALFLIIGVIILSKNEITVVSVIKQFILIIGVFLSGSRVSFVVLCICILGIIFTSENKREKRGLLMLFCVVFLSAIIYSAFGNSGAFNRFLKISFNSITFKGRILYIKDALKQIIKHPLGLGYMGYYFTQGTFQTGVYSNQFVHNDILQMALDIGWIPCIAFFICIVKNIMSKNKPKYIRLIIIVIIIHTLMDFDLQYLIIDFILLICLYEKGKEKIFGNNSFFKLTISAILVIGITASFVFGITSALYLTNNSKQAVKICPYNTMAQIDHLKYSKDISEKKTIAEQIIKNNKSVANSYDALAAYYYSQGDVEGCIKNKKQAILLNPYSINEYNDLCAMLIRALGQYIEINDYNSANYILNELNLLQDLLDSQKQKTDKLAFELNEKPDFELNEEYVEIINYYNKLFHKIQ